MGSFDDTIYTCHICGRKIGISCFSSAGYTEIYKYGWDCVFKEVKYTVKGEIIESEYTGTRTIKDYKMTENFQIITCDICILNKQRFEKLKKIKENVNKR